MQKRIVVLTGAGISAESGIATFRDGNGLWENHRIEDVATPAAWKNNPQLVLDFYNTRRRSAYKSQPNQAHLLLADLEKAYQVTIITQNVDDLHERAGSSNVLHLHGSLFSKCSDKNRHITAPCYDDIHIGEVALDSGHFRPDIVWFGEAVPNMAIAIPLVEQADIFIVIGTSLQVYPAAGLVDHVRSSTACYYIDVDAKCSKVNKHFKCIAQTATEGLKDLAHHLLMG